MEKTFELKLFKIGVFGVDAKYRLSETENDGIVTNNDLHVKVTRPIHKDLENLFCGELSEIVANILGNESATATGVAFAGKNDNIGITIFGTLETPFGPAPFKTPRIKYLTSESKEAARLTVFADKIVDEAHAYLIENKTEELAVFGE